MYIYHSVCRFKKRALDALKLELQVVVNHYMDAEVFCKSIKCS